ncbi:radical SAM/SPASM domain-containing protein [Silvanigrella aquatica]|uniref:Radical SAM core domain-containing protein n=1 Tax=Silvanigrella aquatica TaxID=1915309 RepID=A0A1L4CXT9_9BACT|nr:radical SAM protein [Silvanigrella aquatica]APJ02756.1 hypothetical protein AXG55_01975 [Silvanigrella aquatica]
MSFLINFQALAMRKYGTTWSLRNIKNKQSILLKDDAADFWDFLLDNNSSRDINDYLKRFEEPEQVEKALNSLAEILINNDMLIINNEIINNKEHYNKLINFNNSENYNQLANELCEISLMESKILLTEIELTHACNFRCLHCYQPESWKQSKLPGNLLQWKKALDKLESLGVLYLIFSGGECTLLPYFRSLVSYARERYFDLSIITNGYYLNDSLCKFLLKMNLSKITVSVYGFDSNEYETFTKIKDSHKKVNQNILLAKSYGLPVCARIICTKYQKNLSNTLEFYKSHGIDTEIIYEMMNKIEKDDNSISEMVIKKHEISELLNNQLDIIPPSRSCTAGTLKIRIEPDGSIIPCELLRMKMANIFNDELNDLINKPLFKSTRNFVSKFNNTKSKNGCPVMGGLLNERILKNETS